MAKSKQRRVIWRGRPLRQSAGIQNEYVAKIMQHVDKMIKEARKELESHFKKEYTKRHIANYAEDASVGSQTRILINALKSKYDQMFNANDTDISNNMLNKINKNSYDSLLYSMKGNPKFTTKELSISLKSLDKETKEILKLASARSANFIQTIPSRYVDKLADAVYNSITKGEGWQDLLSFLDKHDTGIKNWVHNTAMDQTRKTYNGLNAGRMNKIGIDTGEWIHSGGSQHPRPLHQAFDGKQFSLKEGAPVGDDDDNVMPGDDANCRCTFTPVLTDDPGHNYDDDDD